VHLPPYRCKPAPAPLTERRRRGAKGKNPSGKAWWTEKDPARLRNLYTDISGTRHLSWVQYASEVPVFGNGLKANVAKEGA